MDFGLGPHSEDLRAQVRSFLEKWLTPDVEERLYRSGVAHDGAFSAALAERGWLAPDYPVELGGPAMSTWDKVVLAEELQHFDAPVYGTVTTEMVGKTLLLMASQELQDEIIPKVVTGEVVIALGYTEPESGSDVAAAQCRAVRDGNEWVITGQKMFTTNAQIADFVFLLARTNTEVAKHKGLTTFLLPLDLPGIEVQAVYTLSGERTNITYYNDVRVDDRWRIGDVDGGWAVVTAALQDEHAAGYAGHLERLLDAAEEWARECRSNEGTRLDDAEVQRRLARTATELEVAVLLQRRAVWMDEQGLTPEAEGPMAKLFSSEALVRCAQDLFELVGPDALRSFLEPSAPAAGRIEQLLRHSLGTTIYAGTSEVQRNIIAQRGLGLPR
jgi:alkylation response protein AidB-like acyl-CoA dehydrogenase